MTFEQVERAIQFSLDQQAAFWASSAEFNERFKKREAEHEKLKEELEVIKEITRGLVTVAQMHSRRLDRLDGFDPS